MTWPKCCRHIFETGEPIGKYRRLSVDRIVPQKRVAGTVRPPGASTARRDRSVKYLGGRSYARKNEVGLFQFRWEGYYINYDQGKLKEHDNVLPPLSNFLQEKIVLCQHAPRITAAYDGSGEFVTKDVYPVGIAAPGLPARRCRSNISPRC